MLIPRSWPSNFRFSLALSALDLKFLQLGGSLRAVCGTQFPSRVGEVTCDRVRTKGETLRDGPVGEPVSSEIENLNLAFTERCADGPVSGKPAREGTDLVGASSESMDDLAGVGGSQLAHCLDRGQSCRNRRLRIVDVSHGHLHGHVATACHGGELHDRNPSPTSCRK